MKSLLGDIFGGGDDNNNTVFDQIADFFNAIIEAIRNFFNGLFGNNDN